MNNRLMNFSEILVFVFKNPLGNCTNNGISGNIINMELVVENCFDPKKHDIDKTLILRIKESPDGMYLFATPTDEYIEQHHSDHLGPMFGGNFIHTSDSRFPSNYPIPVHDRFETQH